MNVFLPLRYEKGRHTANPAANAPKDSVSERGIPRPSLAAIPSIRKTTSKIYPAAIKNFFIYCTPFLSYDIKRLIINITLL